MQPIKLKSLEEVIAFFRELVHRHRRRFLKRNLRPCPYNCKFADEVGRTILGCPKCGSRNPEFCKRQEQFVPLYSKEELIRQFRRALRDPKVLLRDYRDIVVLLWVTGQFDSKKSVPEHIIQQVEAHEEDGQ